ncbi:MAG: hypothetical protein LH630_09620 [Actinomycetia bacterium]|nr:hypothetical protein [Actinomycetes bacterium]
MTGRNAAASSGHDAWATLRRRLALHRRAVSAALAFAAVLMGLTALTNAAGDQPATATPVAERATVDVGGLDVPVQLYDPAVAAMVQPGDVVDVMVADQRSAATLVAANLTVTATSEAEGSGPWTDSDGLLMVAATDEQALALAGAAARGPITIAVHR